MEDDADKVLADLQIHLPLDLCMTVLDYWEPDEWTVVCVQKLVGQKEFIWWKTGHPERTDTGPEFPHWPEHIRAKLKETSYIFGWHNEQLIFLHEKKACGILTLSGELINLPRPAPFHKGQIVVLRNRYFLVGHQCSWFNESEQKWITSPHVTHQEGCAVFVHKNKIVAWGGRGKHARLLATYNEEQDLWEKAQMNSMAAHDAVAIRTGANEYVFLGGSVSTKTYPKNNTLCWGKKTAIKDYWKQSPVYSTHLPYGRGIQCLFAAKTRFFVPHAKRKK